MRSHLKEIRDRAGAYHDSGNKKRRDPKLHFTRDTANQNVKKEPPPGEPLPLWASAPVNRKKTILKP